MALLQAPWWASVVLAVAAFGFCKIAPSLIHTDKPLFAALNAFVPLLPDLAHWPALFFLMIAGLAALGSYRRRELLDSQTGIESIRNLSWQEFELLVGEWFRRQGFAVEENGGGGADGGVDLRLRRDGRVFVVQCKRWKSKQIGVAPVRELYGLMAAQSAAGAYFVSCGEYTRDAKQFAGEVGLVLVRGEELAPLIAAVQPPLKAAHAAAKAPTVPAAALQAPSCPNCGSSMIRRTAKTGKAAGQEFWGCPSFPKCRGTLSAVSGGS